MPTGIYERHRRKKHIELKCKQCGKIFEVPPCHAQGRKKYCSWECRNLFKKTMRGEKSPLWRGGVYKPERYIRCYSPYGCVYQHRIIMENFLGRKLLPQEVVHHINGNKLDNHIENLKLFKNKAEHRRFHANENTLLTAQI